MLMHYGIALLYLKREKEGKEKLAESAAVEAERKALAKP
jgi:hypothetical protein